MLSNSSLLLALGAAVAWGVWALFVRLAERTLLPETVVLVSYVTASLLVLGYVLVTPAGSPASVEGLGWAVAAGLATAVGSLLYYTALARADVGVVSTVTGLYFVVAAVLGVVVLREEVTAAKLAGIGFAVLAVVLLSR